MGFRLKNLSGYDSSDLRKFFEAGFRAMRFPKKLTDTYEIFVMASPVRSRGCAEIGGTKMVISIAAPSNFTVRRLARLFEHEAAHLAGKDHAQMGQLRESLLYSLGPTPKWAEKLHVRYRKRAPNQTRLLSSPLPASRDRSPRWNTTERQPQRRKPT